VGRPRLGSAVKTTSIHEIQGPGLTSPLAGESVVTRGVVTGRTRKGFFVQDPDGDLESAASHGVFVFSRRRQPPNGALVEVEGDVVDYVPHENERPTTQIGAREIRVLREEGPHIEPVWLTADRISVPGARLALFLNRIEGMLAGVEAGATFLAPSNPFGDYVVLPPGTTASRTPHGGVLIDHTDPLRWYPSFRIVDYSAAPRVNVGARLLTPVIGPLNYRASSYQIAAREEIEVRPAEVKLETTQLQTAGTHATVLTLNGFNLDRKLEDPSMVNDPRRDVDDDVRDGRFVHLAGAIVLQAGSPDIVALQEMQDDDGAEITGNVEAGANYALLIRDISRLGGPDYRWADIPPVAGADGGQPGGNIRNAFLFNPARMEIVEGSLRRLGEADPAFEASRKPLVARFRLRETGREVAVVNLHLASKRHQHGLFAPDRPGHDPRLPVRVRQAEVVRRELQAIGGRGTDYYVTGDFNDFEFSETLRAMLGEESVNLVESVPEDQRYDYNHRGNSQALMHGIVSRRQAAERRCDYEILHGNELIGSRPGVKGDKPTDHAYVIARLEMG
jgi:predicted extracellular nuclease